MGMSKEDWKIYEEGKKMLEKQKGNKEESMERLTKRLENGVAYLKIADSLKKSDVEIVGSKVVLEEIYKVMQKLADYEDSEESNKRYIELGEAVEKAFEKHDYLDAVKCFEKEEGQIERYVDEKNTHKFDSTDDLLEWAEGRE